jgi:hypothetical protein
MHRVDALDTSRIMAPHAHGLALVKDLLVLHETVSKDIPGWRDITSIEAYLAHKGYGIHGMTDAEGHKAWAVGLGRAIFYHAGGVNVRACGIEQVSNIMLRSPRNVVRRHIWAARHKQLRATALLVAAWHDTHPQHRPLVYSNGLHPGVTSHWDVSQHFSASEGHTDCHPAHKGGYYPILEVIRMARLYAKTHPYFGPH